MICFDADGSFLSEKTNQELAARLSKVSKAVIPGFYGSMPDGSVKTSPEAVPISPALW